jgi:hypothetical protein
MVLQVTLATHPTSATGSPRRVHPLQVVALQALLVRLVYSPPRLFPLLCVIPQPQV